MRLTIEKLIYGGDGLARLPADEHGRGKAVFVPFVLPGEEVEATLEEERPGFARGSLEQIVQPSPQRIAAACPYFQRCGGCHYQHMDYAVQLENKAAILRENLRRIAKIDLGETLQLHPSPPWNYRNRVRLKVASAPEFALGYYRMNSHELLAVEQCPISSPLINRTIAGLWELGRAGKIAEGIAEIELFANGDDTQLLVEALCSLESTPELASPWMESLYENLHGAMPEVSGVAAFRVNSGRGSGLEENLDKPLALTGAGALLYRTTQSTYHVGAGSFFQVNRYLIDELVSLVTGGRRGVLALDLYAGMGLFSTVLAASFAQVIAVESSQTAHTSLRQNSPANVKAVRATIEEYLQKVEGKVRPDFIVADPPRSGLGARVVRSLAGMKCPRMTYVSCDPATLARDLGQLLGAGFRLEQVQLVDLFPQTYHLETVVHLAR